MAEHGRFESIDATGLTRLGIITIGGALGICVAILVGESAIQGVLPRPGNLVIGAIGVYVLVLGGWCGWSRRTSICTVVVSGSATFAVAIPTIVSAFIRNPFGAPYEGPNWRLFPLFFILLWGVSLFGYWIGEIVLTTKNLRFDAIDMTGLAHLAIVTIGGVLGIYAAFLAGQTAIRGALTRPNGDLVTAAHAAYALALGGWCGWTGRTSNSTVVVSVGFVFALAVVSVTFAFVEPLGPPHGTNWRLLALVLVMLLGVVQAVSLVGYWIGKAIPN